MGFGFVVLGALSTRGSDPFHVCKYGIGRHFCGSALVLLASWNTWGAAALNFDERMTRAFDDFLFCCSVELKGTPHCKSFTRDGLHFDRETSFPWAGWKGSDTMLVLRWMVRLIRYGIVTTDARSGTSLLSEPPGPQQLLQFQKDVLQAILDGACSMVRFFQILYHSGAWLDRKAARGVALNVNMFCASYYSSTLRHQRPSMPPPTSLDCLPPHPFRDRTPSHSRTRDWKPQSPEGTPLLRADPTGCGPPIPSPGGMDR